MSASWLPSGKTHDLLSQASWSAAEEEDAARAVRQGLDELIAFFEARPARVHELEENAVQCFLDISYAASNMPALQARARTAAHRVLTELLAPYLKRNPASVTCDEYSTLLEFTVYAHGIYPAGDEGTATMVRLANAAADDCGALQAAMGSNFRQLLDGERILTDPIGDLVLWSLLRGATGRDFRRILYPDRDFIDQLYELVLWSIVFTEAQLVPGLELPDGARELLPKFWGFLSRYPLVDARIYADGAYDGTFFNTAYLATHIGYIPTGYGRNPIYVEDAPYLFRFLRENFYAVLEMGELDLVAEFVDLFRQYGCTEQNDLQVRDGTRYLLKLFHAAGDSWIAHREPYEKSELDEYDLMHKPWTGVGGVRVRVVEPPVEGTYGRVFRDVFGSPR